jgi:protein PhnA
MIHSLANRANNTCEICSIATTNLNAFAIYPKAGNNADEQVALCDDCNNFITTNNYSNPNHFSALTGSIWSETPAVKVLSYKLLQQLNTETWAAEALDGAYLDEAELLWANAETEAAANAVIHKDAYGVVLQNGDSVLLTDNLNVKGTSFTATKGTKVLKIRLVHDNAEQIEGKVNGTTIVILTKFVRKTV